MNDKIECAADGLTVERNKKGQENGTLAEVLKVLAEGWESKGRMYVDRGRELCDSVDKERFLTKGGAYLNCAAKLMKTLEGPMPEPSTRQEGTEQ